ncbi:MAG: hypothetical protein JWQ96_2551 [Segetibacter sp.]|nr:hypothetical protein [Segetibacter sp.]
MEMRDSRQNIDVWLHACLCVFFSIGLIFHCIAQTYTLKNGKMHIELSRNIKAADLNNFISKYNLSDIGLMQLIFKNKQDSLKDLGWNLLSIDKVYVITKPVFSFDNINNPAERIVFTEKPVSAGLNFFGDPRSRYGFNRFRNKFPFAVHESTVTFFLRNNTKAGKIALAGSFNNWVPGTWLMTKTDSGWIANVKLKPGKHWYKFIVDGNWRIDDDNLLKENDGRGNTNSVFFLTNTTFTLQGFTNARNVFVAGSFNNWRPRELQLQKSANGWRLPIYLPEGTHTYRFVVDGDWRVDPANPNKLPNEFSDFNSVIRIGKPHLFRLAGYTEARRVVLSGTFNNWREDELLMNKTASGWELPYVLGPGNYEYRFKVDNKWITDPANPITINNRNSYLIVQPNYTFRLKGYAQAKTVYLAVDFNSWSPNTLAMKKEGEEWTFKVNLAPGKHRYKFFVDGKWIVDPSNKQWEQNEFGTGNSVVWVEN